MASDPTVSEKLSRRHFLRQTFAFSAAAALAPVSGFALAPHHPVKSDAAHLLMLGDWGRETVDQAQHLVAQGMIDYTRKNRLSPQAIRWWIR